MRANSHNSNTRPKLAPPDAGLVDDLVRQALAEDLGSGDATTLSLVPAAARVRAVILTRRPIVVAGGPVAARVFARLSGAVRVKVAVPDGSHATAGQTLLELEGPARAILSGERTALNLMQRLTGIATLTARFVAAVRPHPVTILDTRKTTPGLRFLEKYAVRCGGGANHRFGLYDRILVKDNHRRLWNARADLANAVCAARAAYPALAVEVEVESEAELRDVLRAAPEWILLDNMTPARLRRCVALARGRTRLEASGGITLRNVRAVAATGVDALSLGCLTHSAPAADLSLEIESNGVF